MYTLEVCSSEVICAMYLDDVLEYGAKSIRKNISNPFKVMKHRCNFTLQSNIFILCFGDTALHNGDIISSCPMPLWTMHLHSAAVSA